MKARPVRVLLVDDAQFLNLATHFLAAYPRIEVVAWASSGSAALKLVAHLHPDVVLMDLNMPGMNGLEVTRQIKAFPGAPCVILVTLHDSAEYREVAKTVHADGFITKSEFGAQLLPLIDRLFPESPL